MLCQSSSSASQNLHTFLCTQLIQILGLVQAVVASVSQQYAAMVSELLDMLQKTEQSLARVRRNKPADAIAAADGAELSNIQKISLQLFLDTQVCSGFRSCVCAACSDSLLDSLAGLEYVNFKITEGNYFLLKQSLASIC